jgi:hypothetical protein
VFFINIQRSKQFEFGAKVAPVSLQQGPAGLRIFITIMAISCHVYICRAQGIIAHQARHGKYNEIYSGFFMHFLYLE